ncbi:MULTISPECIES: TIGR02452 family protein [unclassified Micromonospora]|uniref:TIGR02452 family protein n=1 Tax=unclassified Micromonospora TaxID=2617518 RepID=UPI002FF263E8
MDRTERAALAAETDRLVAEGRYGPVPAATLHLPDEPLREPGPAGPSTVEVTDETSLAATRRLAGTGDGRVACLNFASAKKPGGGYATGAHAQEESLARSSALVASLRTAPEFHAYHRARPDPVYSDRVVHSPDVPVFRDDAGRLIPPYRVAFLTAAAPNAGALREPVDLPGVLRRRAGRVLGVALAHGHRRLVLGAWGCGVFRNDPRQVAAAFADLLGPDRPYAGRFDLVVFAVPDATNRGPFAAAFG